MERAGEHAFAYTLHGGSEPVTMQWHFFGASRLPVAVQTWELPPGGSEGMHAHEETEPLDELYLVLAGRARMRVDEAVYDLAEGDGVLAVAGARHDLVNTGSAPLRVLVVWGRPGQADWSAFGSARAAATARAGE